jgi:hypothetical protein
MHRTRRTFLFEVKNPQEITLLKENRELLFYMIYLVSREKISPLIILQELIHIPLQSWLHIKRKNQELQILKIEATNENFGSRLYHK